MERQKCIDTIDTLNPLGLATAKTPMVVENPVSGVKKAMLVLFKILWSWEERRRQRAALAKLSDHHLKDIGLSRADVDNEVTKPIWQR